MKQCDWMEQQGLTATDVEWQQHVNSCHICGSQWNEGEFMTGNDAVSRFFTSYEPAPAGLIDAVMERISLDAAVSDQTAQRMTPRRSARRPRRNSQPWLKYAATAAVVVIAAGAVLRVPVAHAITYVVDKVETTFFAQDKTPMPVKVTQVTPAQEQAMEQDTDVRSADEKSIASVFEKHRQEIVSTYQQLREGESHALRFSDGTSFLVSKQTMANSLDALKSQSKISLPIMQSPPAGLAFDEGTLRMSGDGTTTAEVNLLYTTGGKVKQSHWYEYEKYTDPSFTVGNGPFIHINMVFADGILGTEYMGDFELKKAVTVQGNSGVLMKYADSWKDAPGLVRLAFGVTQGGHHFTIQMDARGMTPDQLLQAAESIQWEK